MDSMPKVLPRADWPDIDRKLWESCLRAGLLARLNHDTTRRIERTYGRWMQFLRARGDINKIKRPSELVTVATVAAFIARLERDGCKRRSIKMFLWQLRAALRAMEPGLECDWVKLPRAAPSDDGRCRRRRQFQPRPTIDPLREWPEIDRNLWTAGTTSGDPLDGPRCGASLSNGSREKLTRTTLVAEVLARPAGTRPAEAPCGPGHTKARRAVVPDDACQRELQGDDRLAALVVAVHFSDHAAGRRSVLVDGGGKTGFCGTDVSPAQTGSLHRQRGPLCLGTANHGRSDAASDPCPSRGRLS